MTDLCCTLEKMQPIHIENKGPHEAKKWSNMFGLVLALFDLVLKLLT
jgi:hypothetical protein